MNLSEFLEKKLSDSNKTNNLVSDFIKDLQNHLENAELNIENGSKFVVTDINDDTVSLVNIENGDELKTSNFRKDDLINLDLGSNVIFKDNRFSLTNEEFEITNLNAKSKLDDLFFNIDEEEGSLFSVKKIDNDKIYLTNIQEGGYFSISKDKYPDFNVGDTVKKGQTVAIIEAMKLENEIQSQFDGKVVEIKANKGASVNNKDVLIVLG